MQSKHDILQAVRNNAARVRSFGVDRIGLFGSFVRATQTAGSDVDLLVQFNPAQKTFDNFMGLSQALEDILHRRVELVTPESLSPYIGPRILAEVEYVPLDG